MSLYQKRFTQFIPVPPDEVWAFIASPSNLKNITPPEMRFEIVTPELPEEMYAGMMVEYRLYVLPALKISWLTEITHIEDKSYFVDEQRIGPYAIWHHEHRIVAYENGTMMTDLLSYKLPFGFFGHVLNKLFISKRIQDIFNYRRTAVERFFRTAPDLNKTS